MAIKSEEENIFKQIYTLYILERLEFISNVFCYGEYMCHVSCKTLLAPYANLAITVFCNKQSMASDPFTVYCIHYHWIAAILTVCICMGYYATVWKFEKLYYYTICAFALAKRLCP
jgi:hypothetical protein